MFDIGFAELLLIGVVGLLVVGPEQLPGAVRTVLAWVNRFRRSFDQIRTEVRRELHNDEIWILAPLAYSAEAGLLETERDVDASGTPRTLKKLKNVPALKGGVLRMGEPFVLWRARTSAGSDGVWRVRYAGPQQVDLRSRQRAGSAAASSNTLSMDADAIEARQFALEMHEASSSFSGTLAHARAVLRRYHVFYQVTEHDVKLASSSA